MPASPFCRNYRLERPRHEVVPPRLWKEHGFHARTSARWYAYTAGRFNSYAHELVPSDLPAEINRLAARKNTRVPPIFSKIGVQVSPGILD